MCGITAIFGKYNKKEEFIRSSLDKIKHRGTSIFEYKVFDNAALGANRLPIVGREKGIQPLSNEEKTIFAVQNGEIFNYKDLKQNLENKGHKFQTDCDTEVLVHLYEEYGEKLIEHIDSEMFAFAIYDKKKNKFYVARDRFGVKPLFFTSEGGNFYFASEMKQLTQFDFIKEIKVFPKGSYMVNGKIKKYYELSSNNSIKNFDKAKRQLTKHIIAAVKKRVDTDLPITVLLSGGVDSSLIMEIATRFHKDVTAFILGRPGAPDYEAAVRLCKDSNYKYQIVYPDVDYQKELDKLIYHLELYEAQIIRQSFALDILSKAVVRAGYRIALVGEASDEIFGGYNQFSALKPDLVNKGCVLMTESLEKGHNIRVDRMSMKHTLETRAPFFDTKVVDYAMKIDGKLKIKKENHQITTKYILREVAKDFLPDYIADRYKIAFANGAGMSVGFNYKTQDGEIFQAVMKGRKVNLPNRTKQKYGFLTKEEELYFDIYRKFRFDKLYKNEVRIVTKDNLVNIDKSETKKRMLVAEFGKLPIYFPIYFATHKRIYDDHGINMEFISTGGDDLTYNSLMNGSAQIGIADPIFTFTENKYNIKGKIVGQLIGKVPLFAVTLNPNIKINNISDFAKYKIGTFQKFSTTNTIMKELMPEKDFITIKNTEILEGLKDRNFDIAIVTAGYAYEIEAKGGHIIYSFEKRFGDYCFTGISISNNLDKEHLTSVKSFLTSVKESINLIKKDKSEALKIFRKEFPDISNHKELLDHILHLWNTKLTIDDKGIKRITHTWKTVYPWLLKSNSPQFIELKTEDKIISLFNNRDISRDILFKEDVMAQLIKNCIDNKKSINIVGFWGASDKKKIDYHDKEAIKKFVELNDMTKKIHTKGIKFIFILADEHARLNKYPKSNYSNYLKQINKELHAAGFETILLSKLWEKRGLSDTKINSKLKKLDERKWNDLKNRKELIKSAKNKGFKDPEKEAKRYYINRILESKIMEKEFPNSIFHTYGEDLYQNLYPNMPTMYLWVGKRGYTHSPWFET